MVQNIHENLQLQNLDNVIDNLNLLDGSNTQFNSAVDGSDGNQVNEITRQSGAQVGFGDNIGVVDKNEVLIKAGVGNVNGIGKSFNEGILI